MELELIRTYFPSGTNGKILHEGRLLMYSIELPWKDNHARVSCIPEGSYELVKRCFTRRSPGEGGEPEVQPAFAGDGCTAAKGYSHPSGK